MNSEKIKGDLATDFSGHWTEARDEGKVIIDKDYVLALEAENKRLRAALEVYANDKNWQGYSANVFVIKPSHKFAQDALESS